MFVEALAKLVPVFAAIWLVAFPTAFVPDDATVLVGVQRGISGILTWFNGSGLKRIHINRNASSAPITAQAILAIRSFGLATRHPLGGPAFEIEDEDRKA